MDLRSLGKPLGRGARFLERRVWLVPVKEREREIQPADRQRRIDLQRFAERLCRPVVIELLEARDSKIVRAVGPFTLRSGRLDRRRRERSRREPE